MINIMKGAIFGRDTPTYGILMQFRDDIFCIENLSEYECAPFLGVKLDKEWAEKLIIWLQSVIEKNKICDDCYNYKMPENFIGEINCLKCKNIIKNI
jgi:hypothetical protein